MTTQSLLDIYGAMRIIAVLRDLVVIAVCLWFASRLLALRAYARTATDRYFLTAVICGFVFTAVDQLPSLMVFAGLPHEFGTQDFVAWGMLTIAVWSAVQLLEVWLGVVGLLSAYRSLLSRPIGSEAARELKGKTDAELERSVTERTPRSDA